VAGQQVCTNTNQVGDRFTATLSEGVTASNGAVLPAGSTAVLEVTGVKDSQQAGDNMIIGLAVRSISYAGKSYPVNGSITSAQTQKVRATDNHDAAKVAGGAVVGAILGRIFSGKSKTKGTVIGAAGGAAAGAVVANQTAKYNACIPNGGRITVRLDQAMQIQSIGSSSGGSGI
jgi:outer membrane lipoprotein SlyB